MYGKGGNKGKSQQSYGKGGGAKVSPYGHGQQKDPTHHLALEELLKVIALRAVDMSYEEIEALAQTFEASSASSAGGGRLPPPPPPPVAVGGWPADEYGCQQQPYGFGGEDPHGRPRGPVPSIGEVIGETNVVKVSPKANVKSVAGAMSKSLRGTDVFVATAVGSDGMNHAIKALCISRCYLACEGIDLTAVVQECQAEPEGGRSRIYAFTVARMAVSKAIGQMCSEGVGRTEPSPRFVRPLEQQTEMKVSGNGQASNVAGAIAKCTREGKEVVITSIGPASVARAVEALAMAREYVRPDDMELVFYCGFEQVIMDGSSSNSGEQRCAVKFHAWAEHNGAAVHDPSAPGQYEPNAFL